MLNDSSRCGSFLILQVWEWPRLACEVSMSALCVLNWSWDCIYSSGIHAEEYSEDVWWNLPLESKVHRHKSRSAKLCTGSWRKLLGELDWHVDYWHCARHDLAELTNCCLYTHQWSLWCSSKMTKICSRWFSAAESCQWYAFRKILIPCILTT